MIEFSRDQFDAGFYQDLTPGAGAATLPVFAMEDHHMELREAALLARVSVFAGIIMLLIGIVSSRDVFISTAGLVIFGGVVATAIVAHAMRRP